MQGLQEVASTIFLHLRVCMSVNTSKGSRACFDKEGESSYNEK